jgi:hypothetical protein
MSALSWIDISRFIHAGVATEAGKREEVAQRFGLFWRQLADETSNEREVGEYSGLKHGMRVAQGTGLRIGRTAGKMAGTALTSWRATRKLN